ncbi:MAG: cupin domain-containing protein [Flavobacteriales bacterium]|jgi:quercetin dioxygenase-like cupin family protein|nr:cupin domain-containing protein [Flavobacteriales bacterium]|tara:strand:+ start:1270 stop:1815 length:546 start_codon:yes stop_codon:yes gene_type:complete
MLKEKRLFIGNSSDLERIVLHGSSGNPAFDKACAEILHEYSELINNASLLKWIPKTEVTGQGQDYYKKELGRVVVQGYDKSIEDSELLYISVNPGGINHSHREEEFYYAHNGEAIFMLNREEYLLEKGHIYHIAPGLQHGAKLKERVNERIPIELVVLKFPHMLSWIFKEEHSLKVKAVQL